MHSGQDQSNQIHSAYFFVHVSQDGEEGWKVVTLYLELCNNKPSNLSYVDNAGVTKSHIDSFKRIRDARIDRFVVETNKLIIRLDKLVSTDAPVDAGKRKGENCPGMYGFVEPIRSPSTR